MNIKKPNSEDIKKLFKELDEVVGARDKAFKQVEIRDFFHNYYMKQINIILAIAGEMQKHFKEL
jgi:hypothetical protein